MTCPHCGRENKAHDGPTEDATPEPGDVSICWRCHGIGIYTAFGIRIPTPTEDTELRNDPKVRAALAAMAESYTPSQASNLRWGQS